MAQLACDKDAASDSIRELRNSVAELNEALGLSHVEEARLCALGVELREQVAALTNEKETNRVSWSRDKRDSNATIGALELLGASRATELEAVKAELTRVRSELAATTTLLGTRVISSRRRCKGSPPEMTRRGRDYRLVWIHHTWVAHSKWSSAMKGSSWATPEERTEQSARASC